MFRDQNNPIFWHSIRDLVLYRLSSCRLNNVPTHPVSKLIKKSNMSRQLCGRCVCVREREIERVCVCVSVYRFAATIIFSYTIPRDLVVTSNENHPINILFNIVKILK